MAKNEHKRKRTVQLKVYVTADEKKRMVIGADIDQRSLAGFVRHLTLKRADVLIAKLQGGSK